MEPPNVLGKIITVSYSLMHFILRAFQKDFQPFGLAVEATLYY